MVIGWPFGAYAGVNPVEGGVWSRVEKTQKHPRLPCLLIPQPAHAALAGELAAKLLPGIFGEIPPDILQAISMHDSGWAMGDAAQLQRLRAEPSPGSKPLMAVSFLDASQAEAEKAWSASIEYAMKLSPRGGWVVSRHFSLLAASAEQAHQKFLAAEASRRRFLEAGKNGAWKDAAETMGRWTAALGFCDLLSLYLLTGLTGSASLPLAHPSSPEAIASNQVTVEQEAGRLRSTPRIFPAGLEFRLDALRHPIVEKDLRTEPLHWKVV